jgi:hypothetical protein
LELLSRAQFNPQGATVVNDQDFTVPLATYYLKASFGEDTGLLMRNLQLVLASDALQGKQDAVEYIDLRFGSRVYYKLKGMAEAKS